MACLFQKLMYQPYPGAPGRFVKYHTTSSDDLNLKELDKHSAPGVRHFLVPCGQCVECRLQRSRETATRIMLETLTTSDNWAVTCTYDDTHLPYGRSIVDQDGVILGVRPSLNPSDHTKFVKDVRRYFEYHLGVKNIRFYMAGEYGSKSARPHFHYIFFNLPLPSFDVVLLREKSQTGSDLFRSEILESIWSKGLVRLNVVTWQYAAYVARYILKKQLGKASTVYDDLGIVPEFTRCSTRPGLGYDYFKLNQGKLLESDRVLIKRALNIESVPLPKYFLRKAQDDGFDITDLKDRRQENAIANALRIQSMISEDYFDHLKKMSVVSDHKKNSLTRSDF